MEIKDKVKIGSMEYEVIKTGQPLILNNMVCRGIIDYEDLQIKIDSNIAQQRQEETFIHELMHGIIRERNLKLDDEEMIVEELSIGLYQVIKDNSGMFK